MKTTKNPVHKINVRLLRRIQREIKAEPRRFVMFTFVDVSDAVAPCSTAACIAGSAMLLDAIDTGRAPGWKQAGIKINQIKKCSTFETRACEILGLDRTQGCRLFFTSEWPQVFRTPFELLERLQATTAVRRKMAAIANRRIDHFIKTKGAE